MENTTQPGRQTKYVLLSNQLTNTRYLSKEWGAPKNTYSKIEKDEKSSVDDELLEKIANTLGVSTEDIKSPMPIIMNFQDSQYNAPFGTQHNHINEKILDSLNEQLKRKDEQIASLLKIIEGK